jgi:hypothetical protein
MTDHDNTALIVIERFSDDWEMTEVDMVCWLIEDEEMWFLEDKSSIAEEAFLTFGESVDWIFYEITDEEKL